MTKGKIPTHRCKYAFTEDDVAYYGKNADGIIVKMTPPAGWKSKHTAGAQCMSAQVKKPHKKSNKNPGYYEYCASHLSKSLQCVKKSHCQYRVKTKGPQYFVSKGKLDHSEWNTQCQNCAIGETGLCALHTAMKAAGGKLKRPHRQASGLTLRLKAKKAGKA